MGFSAELYSVRKVGGYKPLRGFVEIRDCTDNAEEHILQLKTGICYVECRPHMDPNGAICQHVRAASESVETAEPLAIQWSALELLDISAEIRATIWKQQESCQGAAQLVQKVSSDTFVVKCEDEVHQPIPYCHVQLKPPSSISYDCQILNTYDGSLSCYHAFVVAAAVLSSSKYRSTFEPIVKHLLLPEKTLNASSKIEPVGLSALSLSTSNFQINSDVTGANTSCNLQMVDCNFSFEIEEPTSLVINETEPGAVCPSPIIELINSTETSSSVTEAFAAQYDDDNLQLMDCQIELMDQFNLTDRIDFCPSDIELSDDNLVFPADEEIGLVLQINDPSSSSNGVPAKKKSKLIDVTTKKAALRESSRVAKEKFTKGSYNVRKLMKILESNGVVFNRLQKLEAVTVDTSGAPSFEAKYCNLSFNLWLESVIEQLNSVITYQGNGRPEVQTFSVHEDFFQCLRARFSVGHYNRAPDHSFEIAEIGPTRGLTCHVFKFSCYKSLRNVLKTHKISLQFEKSFCKTRDGTFEEIDSTRSQSLSEEGLSIKPFEYKTYIKMGCYKMDPNQETHYFVIEWIAGVLPKSRFGEMRINFRYGHKENNLYVTAPETKFQQEVSALNDAIS
ncbi:uncharacterized protein C2orf42 homolog [Uranotaenia lowii]|uniref:uncharacterized protein C2orf42 homolog n=1 Tax=Uranotaenia lowii TaxID=190385 RepID=UPI0024797CEF|nr:uncharacterized protein C2orf42 homolog [Uranotaenia lowii]XP_055587926.1 uncharacterized protein C2orf42 homolog [Uranotaenia lowii]